MIWWPSYQWYPYALGIALVVTLIAWDRALIACVAAIALSYFVMQAVGDQYCVKANVAADITAGEIAIGFGQGHRLKYLLPSWIFLMAAHAGFVWDRDKFLYWYTTSFLSWAQVALLLTWGGSDGGKRIRRCVDSFLCSDCLGIPLVAYDSHTLFASPARRNDP